MYVHIPTHHPFSTSDKVHKDFPIKNLRKYLVFRDLWSKGVYITTGDSFGCDFLTYPSDPMYFHASQVVHIVDQYQPNDVKYLISCCRLSVSVNKQCLFAYANEDNTITYQKLTWDNPKLRQLYPTQSIPADNGEECGANVQADCDISDDES